MQIFNILKDEIKKYLINNDLNKFAFLHEKVSEYPQYIIVSFNWIYKSISINVNQIMKEIMYLDTYLLNQLIMIVKKM